MDNYNPIVELDELLGTFKSALINSKFLETTSDWTSKCILLAKIGFDLTSPTISGRGDVEDLIRTRLQNGLSLDSLTWYEEAAEPISAFSCYVLGAFFGKLRGGQITDREFLLADVQLPGFIDINEEEICQIYSSTR